MAASRMWHGVTNPGSPMPSDTTLSQDWTMSKKSRMPELGNPRTCSATKSRLVFGGLDMARYPNSRDCRCEGFRLETVPMNFCRVLFLLLLTSCGRQESSQSPAPAVEEWRARAETLQAAIKP